MAISNGVLEIARTGRIIRIDATTIERLEDVKVAGEVIAFDSESVITQIQSSSLRSAYSFPR